MNHDFFANAGDDYEVPKSDAPYLKFKEPGTYKFRLLDKPIFGWEGWVIADGKDKPIRFDFNEKPTDVSRFKRGELNHFWAMPVWNFHTNRVEVLSLTTKSIQTAIEGYARNEDWGSPLSYNLTVTREGTTKENTKYTTMPSPHSELQDDIKAAWNQVKAEGFDITAILRDEDPFNPATKRAQTAPPPPQTYQPAPTPAEDLTQEDTEPRYIEEEPPN
ncbi:hypothetical protein [Tsuneonella sp. HG222]